MKNMATVIRTIGAWGAACVLSVGVLVAAAPQPPVGVTAEGSLAEVVKNGVPVGTFAVDFRWKPNPKGDAADGYRIYRWSEGNGAWTMLTTTTELNWRLTEEQRPLADLEHYFYITAYNKDGESIVDNKLYVSFKEPEQEQKASVYFTSVPPVKLRLGTSYVYDADAVGRNGGDVYYELYGSAKGASVDRETGVVTWTPESAGDYKFVLHAILRDDPSKIAAQPWAVRVVDAEGTDNVKPVFTSKPQEQAHVGELYAYDAEVQWKGDVRYTLRHAPEGATVDEKTGLVLWTPDREGYVKFYLEAVVNNGTADIHISQSWAVKADAADPDKKQLPVLEFTSKPSGEAFAYVPYVYEPQVHWKGGDVKFALVDAPAGAEVDANGRVTWTPTAAGDYKFLLRASAESTLMSSEALQVWVVRVQSEKGGEADQVTTPVGDTAPSTMHTTVYPNPATTELTLRFDARGASSIAIADDAGRVLYRSERPAGQGVTTLPLDVSGFASGRYFVRVETGGRVQTIPLTIAR